MITSTGINANWTISSNVGDRITPFLIEHIAGVPAIWTKAQPEKHLLGCGSILNHAQAKNVVWGAGLASFGGGVNAEADIRSVRGPLSRAVAMTCGCLVPDVIGDPALLVSQFIKPNETVPGRIGLVPHYVDQQRAVWWYGDDDRVTIIDVLQSVEDFVADLTTCDFVFSSSLHGLILADAYCIPNARVIMGEDIGGDGMKFFDHDLAWHGCIREGFDLTHAASEVVTDHPLPLAGVEAMSAIYRAQMGRMGDEREGIIAGLLVRCPFKTGGLR